MKHTLAVVGITATLTSCTFGRHATPAATTPSPSSAVTSTTVGSPSVTAGTSAVEEANGGGLFPEGPAPQDPPAASVAPSSPPPLTILVPVPPLPADMTEARPSTPPAAVEPDEHDHNNDGPAAGDVAAGWIAAVYTGRYDEPATAVGDALRPLAASDAVADAALAAVNPVDIEGGEARWPYIAELADAGDGWWQASVLVKSTRFGQVGPSSTAITVRVHVTGELLVDDWEPTA